jgi:predicted translin family RNA/ssDNA-binding protein
MINKKFVQQLKKEYDNHESERRQIISLANVVLHDSKRVIFSLHRADSKKAGESLAEIEKILVNLEKKFGFSRLAQEGSYKAGVEEYVEAKMFYKLVSGEKVDIIKGFTISAESYLSGICDLTGELVRQAVNLAAKGKLKEAVKAKGMVDEIMAELIEFDMTGYLRTKYDQAKGNLRKMEQINYEISLRK